jgi:outer membrane lipoprotein-sorting protein
MVKPTELRRLALALVITVAAASVAGAQTADSIRKQLAAASSGVHDLKGIMVVTAASRSNAGEINKGVLQFLDQGFREASIAYKRPDKFRAEGKARGIDIIYVVNGNKKQVIAPAIMLKKTDDLTNEREKKQSSLDVGFASDSLWVDNSVKLILVSKGVAKLQLVPRGTRDKRKELLWLDTKTLKVLKRERYTGAGKLKARYIYSAHRMMGRMPVATLVKAYAPDGGYAGSISYKNLQVNTGLPDSLFAIR